MDSCRSILTFCPCKDCIEEEKDENIDEYSICIPCNGDCVEKVYDKKMIFLLLLSRKNKIKLVV